MLASATKPSLAVPLKPTLINSVLSTDRIKSPSTSIKVIHPDLVLPIKPSVVVLSKFRCDNEIKVFRSNHFALHKKLKPHQPSITTKKNGKESKVLEKI